MVYLQSEKMRRLVNPKAENSLEVFEMFLLSLKHQVEMKHFPIRNTIRGPSHPIPPFCFAFCDSAGLGLWEMFFFFIKTSVKTVFEIKFIYNICLTP